MPEKNPNITEDTFEIELSAFYQGFSPAAHLNALTELGNRGHASVMQNVDVLTPSYMTQGPGLADLTNGDQDGVVDQLINFILDQPTAASKTYGIGTTKLFRITPTSVSEVEVGPPPWPQPVTNMADGQSLILLKGNLYGFYNKSSGGDIFKMPISTEVIDPDWGSTVPTGKAALQKAAHPSAKKEDLIAFGNGRYLGIFTNTGVLLEPTKLDFGNDAEVADVAFHANQWWIAVNSGITGSHRNKGQIYLYDGGAVSSILSDETAVGLQKIGFLYPINGIVFVAYQDLSFSGGYKIGYIVGRQIIPLAHFTGALPTFAQKTLYKNTILFVSSDLIWSVGAVIGELPVQVSQHADGGHATVGALAAPFGTPMVASTDGGSNHRLAKFSGFDVNCNWKSIIIPLVQGRRLGYIDEVIVFTGVLGANARCDLKIESDQAVNSTATAKQITGTGKTRHFFESFGINEIEDMRVFLNWANGNATNDCPIRKMIIKGHFIKI